MAEARGELIGGRYRLVEAVGQGGMGRVWRGRDEVLQRDVAVKEILLPAGLDDGQRELLLQRVMREARAAAGLNHPGIITVHDVVEHNGAPAIVMEFVVGASLAATLREQGRLPVERTARIGLAVLEALAVAHSAGVVHRDLKPDNILLSGSRVVLTDFGIASMADATMALTSTGTILGTPAYMAPEQLEGKPATAASDLWSLGATLYTAAEGEAPFSAPTLTALYVAILTRPPRPTRFAGPLETALTGLLIKDPAGRANAEQTALALQSLLSPPSAGSGSAETGPPAQAPTVPETRTEALAPDRRPTITAPAAAPVSAAAGDGPPPGVPVPAAMVQAAAAQEASPYGAPVGAIAPQAERRTGGPTEAGVPVPADGTPAQDGGARGAGWLAGASGLLSLLAGVLLILGTFHEDHDGDYFSIDPPWSIFWYVLTTGVAALVAAVCTFVPRTRRLVGPAVTIGIAISGFWGVVYLPQVAQDWEGQYLPAYVEPYLVELGGFVALLLSAVPAVIALRRSRGVRLGLDRSAGRSSRVLTVLGGGSTVVYSAAVLLQIFQDGRFYLFGALSYGFLPAWTDYLLALLTAGVPVLAAALVPRRPGAWLLVSWAAASAVARYAQVDGELGSGPYAWAFYALLALTAVGAAIHKWDLR